MNLMSAAPPAHHPNNNGTMMNVAVKTEPAPSTDGAFENQGFWGDLNACLPEIDDSSIWADAQASTSFQEAVNDPGLFNDAKGWDGFNFPW